MSSANINFQKNRNNTCKKIGKSGKMNQNYYNDKEEKDMK